MPSGCNSAATYVIQVERAVPPRNHGLVAVADPDERPAAAYRLSVIRGLVLTFALGAVAGMVMSSGTSHAVGLPVPGDTGLPIVGWLRTAETCASPTSSASTPSSSSR
jgi:hypothetical protein